MTEDVASGSGVVHVRFNRWSRQPFSVAPVTAGDGLVPEAVQATDAAGADAIESIIGRRRSVLARLSLAARTATQRKDQAETALAAQPAVGSDGVPTDLLGVVDVMLEKAVEASELALEAARSEASFIVASAITESVEALRRVGLDSSALPPIRRPAGTIRSVTAPPSAAELWRDVRPTMASPRVVSSRPDAAGGSLTVPASAPAGPAVEPTASLVSSFGPDRTEPAAVRSVMAAAATLLLDAPPARLDDAPVDAFEDFWNEVPAERRVRDRLLRRSAKEGS
jgi:hypothetical protein